MTFRKKFTDSNGVIFIVDEVVKGPVGLTVYYIREHDGERFSCLIDAFSQRFKEIAE